ncbi:MAG TPA: hypothetical protein VIF60_09930 [Burkholderiaceae bacterium]|jgi:hypothetical protein
MSRYKLRNYAKPEANPGKQAQLQYKLLTTQLPDMGSRRRESVIFLQANSRGHRLSAGTQPVSLMNETSNSHCSS